MSMYSKKKDAQGETNRGSFKKRFSCVSRCKEINSMGESDKSYNSKADWNAASKKLNIEPNDITSIGNGKIFKVTDVQPRKSMLKHKEINPMRRKDSLFNPPESVAKGRLSILKHRGSEVKPQKQSALRRKDSVFHPPGSDAKRDSIIVP